MVSLLLLVAILIGIGILFFDVMSSFILPIFLALLLVVMFRPLHLWFMEHCKGHLRVAAGLTTISILLIALLPTVFILWQATVQAMAFYANVAGEVSRQLPEAKEKADTRAIDAAADEIVKLGSKFRLDLGRDEVRKALIDDVLPKMKSWLAPLAVSTGHFAVRFIVGLCIMVVALYYFMADGPVMVDAAMRLSPLDTIYVKQLIAEFDRISRAVVLATLVSALVQGVLAAVGYYFAGLSNVFLLMFLTALFAMIPFVGSTGVWLPACLWLYFYDGHTGAAIGLFIYGTLVVSVVDNVIKPFILHGAANLHPLLALLSVLGGVQALGPIGIFVGPMAVSFMQALLVMVQKELVRVRMAEGQKTGLNANSANA